ncbi:hypothetical protein CYMTET_36454 [Cymbomonas tetramitiformis]|uniref:Uncharacterized protein n=1 Tax=Cymbomonas tetramitiformis TaxID=36881 RepID=A0AAE0CHN3_9CHLO|nr:hypothetical protein CYMTET_36454 [Cymbomonas tetramitiformis]
MVPKTKKCKDMAEWERGFFRITCEAPAEARNDLVDFLGPAAAAASGSANNGKGAKGKGKGGAVLPGEPENSQEAPAGAEKDPVATPGPAVETDMTPVVEMEIEGEDVLAEVEESFGLADVEDDVEMSPGCHATIENMEACGTGENERRCYEEECERVGCSIPTLTSRAHLVAAAFQDWQDVDFLVRCAACGIIALGIVEKVRKGKVKYRPD